MTMNQPPIPATYTGADESLLVQRIYARKKEFGKKLLILAHHYQAEAVFQCADVAGDSLLLAREAAEATDAEWIVFCGVHFMAESADILTPDSKAVFLPHLDAGCPMADMATVEEVSAAWDEMGAFCAMETVIPVTYVNSSAAIKAFVGKHGGSVCTSSNAERVLAWALNKGEKMFFFPDEHLGRNSALALGVDPTQIILWKRGQVLGGNAKEDVEQARVILWDGYCEVHMEFDPVQIAAFREEFPEGKVIVHPESRYSAVSKADAYGSTEAIIKAVAESPEGSVWAVGTEVNLVKRLQLHHPGKTIKLLAPASCQCKFCKTMQLVTPAALLWLLDNLAEGRMVNQITVPEDIACDARLSLARMLET
jgi:quinolinate synthase